MAKPKRLPYDTGTADSDGDGLSDQFELNVSRTNPNLRDTDQDGLTDYEERQYGTNPTMWSSDNDKLSDKQEVKKGTNPWLEDSDGDGKRDDQDRTLGRTFKSSGRVIDTDGDGRDDYYDWVNKQDADGDGLKDGEEFWLRTDRNLKDTDGDGVSDWDEVNLRTNPVDKTSGGLDSYRGGSGAGAAPREQSLLDSPGDDPSPGAPAAGIVAGAVDGMADGVTSAAGADDSAYAADDPSFVDPSAGYDAYADAATQWQPEAVTDPASTSFESDSASGTDGGFDVAGV